MVKKMVKQQTKASINIKDNSRRVIGSSKKSVNRGVWSAEEDQKLFHYVKLHGEKKWKSLPEKAGLNRLGKSCRLRWLNYLRPGIKRGKLSEDEEDLIMRLHNLLGNRWSLIAARLPGRTDNEIKNHWNSHLSKKSLTIHELNLKMNGTLESKKDTHNSATPTCSTSLAAATSPSLVENSPYPHHSFEGFDDMETLTPMSVSSIRTEFDSDAFFDFSGDLDLLRSDPVGDRSELGVLQEDHNNKLFDQGMYQYFLDTELQINISNTTESLDGNQQCWNQLDVDQLVQLLDSNERDGMDPSPSLHSQSQGNGNSNVVN